MTATIKKAVDSHIERAVAEFKKSDIVIAALASNYMPLTIDGVDDKKGYIAVREARLEVKGLRVKVDHKRKELKEDALKYGKAVDTEANRLKALIKPIEEHLQKQEDDYEAAKEKIKAEKAAAAELALQARIVRLTEARCTLPEISFLRDVDDQNFEMYFDKAVDVHAEKERLAKIEADKIAARVAAEQAEQDRLETEYKAECERKASEQRAELARQQESNRVEAERLEAVRAEIHKQAQEAFRQQEAERAELKRQADELRAQQEAQRLRVEAEINRAHDEERARLWKEEEERLQGESESAKVAEVIAIWERKLLDLAIEYLQSRDRGLDVAERESLDRMYEHWTIRPQQ